jgi:AcrR family transcriptional regulator
LERLRGAVGWRWRLFQYGTLEPWAERFWGFVSAASAAIADRLERASGRILEWAEPGIDRAGRWAEARRVAAAERRERIASALIDAGWADKVQRIRAAITSAGATEHRRHAVAGVISLLLLGMVLWWTLTPGSPPRATPEELQWAGAWITPNATPESPALPQHEPDRATERYDPGPEPPEVIEPIAGSNDTTPPR